MTFQSLSGKQAHIWQRLSALYLLIYLPYLAWITLSFPQQADLSSLTANLLSPYYLLPSLIAIVLVLIHSWVGLRDILIDYTPRARSLLWLWGLRWLLIFISINVVMLLINLFLQP
ncbi:MAG: succinate dehydrogenase, hydrophobic membrane anchor protein [Pseudomonadota bacterium]|nr:succinate dehydrogenase, hydrophobic membrane anchor protein [Pseudomonadota bacterium]